LAQSVKVDALFLICSHLRIRTEPFHFATGPWDILIKRTRMKGYVLLSMI